MANLIYLDTTVLLFSPSLGKHGPRVTQITLRAETKMDVGVLANFFLAQREISELISLVVSYHRIYPMKAPAIFEGSGYYLNAEISPWTYGTRWDFFWGDESILAAAEKWKFTFAVRDEISLASS